MNSKIKKLISILILIVIVVSSLTYYENSTEPQGLQGICNGRYDISKGFRDNSVYGKEGCVHFQNLSYMGNKVGLTNIISFPDTNKLNLSCCNNNSDFGPMYELVCTILYINNETYSYPYSNMVISVTNFSIAFNKTMFYNVSSNKGDLFGKYIRFYPKGRFSGNSNTYLYNLGESINTPRWVPMTKAIIPGNYTMYENITFTITVSLGILHFTSNQFSIHESWWELWGYNVRRI